MAVRTKQFAAGSLVSGFSGTAEAYEVPPGYTAILKSIWVSASASTTVSVSLRTSGAAVVLLRSQTVSTTTPIDLQGWWVLKPYDDILITKTSTAVVHFWFSGAELEGVAP